MTNKEDLTDAVWRANYRIKNDVVPSSAEYGESDGFSSTVGLILVIMAILGWMS